MDYLSIFVLSLHVICAAALIGGAIFWRFASPSNSVTAAWKPVTFSAIAGLLLTGIYNFAHRPVKTQTFHMLFGIKMLLALHVFAVSILALRPGNTRRSRQLTGIVISGVVILVISVAFRWV